MVPIYNAIAIYIDAVDTGSTKPCLMTVQDDDSNIIGEFVVKVFSQNNIRQIQGTNKELYCNALAREFDLNVPAAALVRVNQDIIDILKESPKYRNADILRGVYFGSQYIPSALNFSPTILSSLPTWELESIFAFDVFIRNMDRRLKKPNLFRSNGDIVLIDHELSFPSNFDMFDNPFDPKYWAFLSNKSSKHLFLDELKLRKDNEPIKFETFRDYLRYLNVDILQEPKDKLFNTGNDVSDFTEILEYIDVIKNNESQFIDLLINIISD